MPEAETASAEERKGFSRLRSLMIEPGNVYLGHADDRIWLTDQIVILDVAGFPAVQGLEDGWYRIIASGANAGLRARSPGPGLNIAAWLKEIRSRDHYAVTPTELSITESEAKAMLLYVEASGHLYPLAMNEDAWRAFRAAWPEAELTHPGYTGPFRISVPDNKELAYIETVSIPDRLHNVVGAIIDEVQQLSKEASENA